MAITASGEKDNVKDPRSFPMCLPSEHMFEEGSCRNCNWTFEALNEFARATLAVITGHNQWPVRNSHRWRPKGSDSDRHPSAPTSPLASLPRPLVPSLGPIGENSLHSQPVQSTIRDDEEEGVHLGRS